MDDLSLLIDAWPVTNPGQVKTYNEDFVAVYEPENPQVRNFSGNLYVVTDGTGDAASGQVASRYAALKVIAEYYKSTEIDLGMRLRRAILEVNGELYRYVERNPELKKISSSIVAVAVRGEQYNIASVGDCRAYLVRGALIQQLTRDHSLVAGMVEQRTISPEEAKEHPQRDVLLRNLGSQPMVEIDLVDGRLAPDDRLILCSNGLPRHLADQELAELALQSQPTAGAERMVSLANERGGRDNITTIVLGARMGIATPRTPLPFAWDGREPSLGPTPETQPSAEPQAPTMPSAPPIQHPTQPPMPPTQPPQAQPAAVPVQPSPARMTPSYPMPGMQDEATTQIHQRPPYAQPPMQPSPYGAEPMPQPGQPRTYRPPDAGGGPLGSGLGGGPRSNLIVGLLAVVILAVAGVVAAVILLPLLSGGGQGGQADEGGEAPVAVLTIPPADAGITLAPPTLGPEGAGAAATPAPTQQLVPPGMVLVEAGEFLRGASDDEVTLAIRNCIQEGGGACPPELFDDAQPQTNVTLGAFYIDRTEVTNSDYALCVASGTCSPPLDTTRYDDPAYANHPVTNVDWAQAANYCASQGKRLPTEAEWEKAARGTEARIWPWGDTWEPGKANTAAAQLGGPSTVEAFAGDVSAYGVIGMAGNVSEWVNDWYQGTYENLSLVDPTGPLAQPGDEPIKVGRGGSYLSRSDQARGAMRLDVNSGNDADWLGFRCAAGISSTVAPPAAPAPAEEAAQTPEATLAPTATPTGEGTTTP